jgi:hypothetical protein
MAVALCYDDVDCNIKALVEKAKDVAGKISVT